MTQILRNTGATIEETFTAGYSSTTVVVTVTDERGAVVSTGNATQDNSTSGRYTYVVPPRAALARLTASWAGTWNAVAQSVEADHEIVGGYLFTIAQARAYGDGELADTNAYPDSAIRGRRDSIADDFQRICAVPFFPRYEHDFFDGKGTARLWLPYKRPLSIISVHVDGVAYSAGQLDALLPYVTGRVENTSAWPSGAQNIEVEWERGFRTVPKPIHDVALAYAHYLITGSEITDRMVTFANELGTVRLSVPGTKTPTGIPIVDSVLTRFNDTEKDMIAIR